MNNKRDLSNSTNLVEAIPLGTDATLNGIRLIAAVRLLWRPPREKSSPEKQIRMEVNYELNQVL